MWFNVKVYEDNWSGHRCGQGKEVCSVLFEADTWESADREAHRVMETYNCGQMSLCRVKWMEQED